MATTTDDVRKRDFDDVTMSKDSPQHEYIVNNGAATLTVTYVMPVSISLLFDTGRFHVNSSRKHVVYTTANADSFHLYETVICYSAQLF